MDRVLLAVVALGLGFLLWQLHGEVKDLKYAMQDRQIALSDLKEISKKPEPPISWPEQKPCIVQVMPAIPVKKPAPPLQLHPSLPK